jgi:hypothetical protein
VESNWSREAFKVVLWARDERLTAIVAGLAAAGAAFLVAALFLAGHTSGGWRHYGALALRLLMSSMALAAVRLALGIGNSSFFQYWLLLLAYGAIAFFTVRDQIDRCPKCLKRLQMPVSFGKWSSPLSRPPGTEYACPAGHGLLYVSELGVERNRWTVLDDSWKELFAKPEGGE